MTEHELENINFNSDNEEYMLEEDLEYLKELHDLSDDYPLASDRMEVNGVEKLIPNL